MIAPLPSSPRAPATSEDAFMKHTAPAEGPTTPRADHTGTGRCAGNR